jgi:hypothetical protein
MTCFFFSSFKTLLTSTEGTSPVEFDVLTYFLLAGFQVTTIGRIWVTAEEEEMFWMPGLMEVMHCLAIPKDWETPERIEAAEEELKRRAGLEAQGFSPDEVWKLLTIRAELEVGTIYLHPLTGEEMTDLMTVFHSWKDHKTLHFRDPQ